MSVTRKLYDALFPGSTWEELDPISREEFDAIVWNAIKEEVTMSDHMHAAKVVGGFDNAHSNMIDVVAQGLANARRNEREVLITRLHELAEHMQMFDYLVGRPVDTIEAVIADLNHQSRA